MTAEVQEMIFELVKLVEQELGKPLPDGAARRMESELCKQFGGERVYVPKLPKLVAQVRIAAIGTGVATAELARQMGVTPRRIRQIARGG